MRDIIAKIILDNSLIEDVTNLNGIISLLPNTEMQTTIGISNTPSLKILCLGLDLLRGSQPLYEININENEMIFTCSTYYLDKMPYRLHQQSTQEHYWEDGKIIYDTAVRVCLSFLKTSQSIEFTYHPFKNENMRQLVSSL